MIKYMENYGRQIKSILLGRRYWPCIDENYMFLGSALVFKSGGRILLIKGVIGFCPRSSVH
jgi:hypothetical protein